MEQYENETLGPRYAVRLGELRQWHILRATCVRCRHVGIVEPTRLRCRWSEHTRLIELERKLRCTKCGNCIENGLQVARLLRNC